MRYLLAGALLMVCQSRTEDDEASEPPPESPRPAPVSVDSADRKPTASPAPHHSSDFSRPSIQRARSRALVLNANDTGEVAAGAKGPGGRKGEWWENALSSGALKRMSSLPLPGITPQRRSSVEGPSSRPERVEEES